MRFTKATAAILAVSMTALLTGCEAEQTEKDMLAEAQFCLDKANDPTSVNACLSKIDGLTSTQAYSLRCAGGFIASGITSPEKLSQALNSMKDNGSTAGVLGVLAFDDKNLANKTFQSCNLSGDAGLSLISAMSKTATVLNNVAGASGATLEDQMQSAINTILTNLSSGDATLQAEAVANVVEIGGTIQTVYQTTCGGASVANKEICGSINDAIATAPGAIDLVNSTPQEIGDALLQYWKDLNH